MPLTVVQLPNVVTTVGGTQSATIVNCDDATNLYIAMNSTTTSGAAISTVQVEPTDTGTNWFPLSYGSSGQAPITISSSQGVVIPNVAFRQIRLTATGAVGDTARTFIVAKQITVALAGLSLLGSAIAHLLQACGPLAV